MSAGAGRKRKHSGLLLAAALLSVALAQTQTPVTPAPATQTPATQAPATQTPVTQPPAAPDTQSPATDAGASQGASVSLTRTAKDGKQRVITVTRTGDSDATGVFVACQPLDDDPAGTPTISVFSETGAGGIRVSIDKNLIVAPLALVTQKDGGDGHIEVSAGTARALDDVPAGATDRLGKCAIEAKPSTVPDSVNVTQGKTRLKGSKLVYDDSDGVARISGPITFNRQNQSGSSQTGTSQAGTLTGSSGSIEVDVDQQTTTLVGDVTLKDGTRTSSAARVEYDDAANVAILRGTAEVPAKSVTADQTLTASVIRYNLDTGSVVAIGPIGGEFQDGAPDSPATPVQVPAPVQPPGVSSPGGS